MDNEKLRELSSEPVRRLLCRYFWPAFIGVMANSLYNIVDRIFIGQALGAEALSGVTAVFPIMMVMTAFGMLIGVGASVQVSLSLGRHEMSTAKEILGNTVLLIIMVSVGVTLFGFAIKGPMLRFFGANDTTMLYADNYLSIILWGVVFHEFGFSMNAIIRAEGNARIAMYSMLLSAGINIPLDALFILRWGMGVQGAALATIISMAVLSVWVLAHFRGRRCVVPLHRHYVRIRPRIVWAILSIGVSPFLMMTAASAVHAIFTLKLIRYGGDLAVGAMGVILSVVTIVITCIIALNMAAQPIVGYNFGAGNYGRVKETLRLSLVTATLISTLAWLFIQAAPGAIVKLFITDNAELLMLGVDGMRVFLFMLPVIGFQVVAGNFFQSTGKATTAIFLTLLRQVIVLIPLLFILPPILALKGVWLAAPISDSVSASVCGVLLMREWNRISRLAAKGV